MVNKTEIQLQLLDKIISKFNSEHIVSSDKIKIAVIPYNTKNILYTSMKNELNQFIIKKNDINEVQNFIFFLNEISNLFRSEGESARLHFSSNRSHNIIDLLGTNLLRSRRSSRAGARSMQWSRM